MKRIIFFAILLIVFAGCVSASENLTDTIAANSDIADTVSIEEQTDSFKAPQKDTVLKDNGTGEAEKPTISVSNVKGTAGKQITLKATVKNSAGAVSGVTVTFKVNGKTYSAKSNAEGIASVKITCPKTAALKTTQKTSGGKLTKTTTYSKTYSCTASADGASSSFSVISKKANTVKKFKIIKKNKIVNVPIKKGTKVYKKGNYAVATRLVSKNKLNLLQVAVAGKNEDKFIKFYIKEHYKENGKWKWASWFKVTVNKMFESTYGNNIKIDKAKVKYTQVSYKKIK